MQIIISVDGACRGNGKPNCLSTGAAFYGMFTEDDSPTFTNKSVADTPSTNSRGELCGLIQGLQIACDVSVYHNEIYMLMDSEYLFNALTKGWIGNWQRKGWITAEGTPVKNQDLWETIGQHLDDLDSNGVDIIPYHIKGHLVSLGKVTASQMLTKDPTGESLYNRIWTKYDEDKLKHPDKWEAALQLFERNHGFLPEEEVFKKFVVMNTVTDYIAGTLADFLRK